MSSSAKRAPHNPLLSCHRSCHSQTFEMETASVPVPVPEDAMEVNALCEETVDPPEHGSFFFDAAGEFYDPLRVVRFTSLVKFWIVMRQLLESEPSSKNCGAGVR